MGWGRAAAGAGGPVTHSCARWGLVVLLRVSHCVPETLSNAAHYLERQTVWARPTCPTAGGQNHHAASLDPAPGIQVSKPWAPGPRKVNSTETALGLPQRGPSSVTSLTPRPRAPFCTHAEVPWGTPTEQAASRHRLVPAHSLLRGGKCRHMGWTLAAGLSLLPRVGWGWGAPRGECGRRPRTCAPSTATGQAGVRRAELRNACCTV